MPECDICVVGAGPIGIALALACEERGLSVLLLESGSEQPEGFSAALTAGHRVDPTRHAMPAIAICRGLGGTSRWWGGRCVPFDDIDFAKRSHVEEAAWPVSHEEISRWYPGSAAFFGIGAARFVAQAAVDAEGGDVRFNELERWTPEINAAKCHRARLAASTRITVVLGATVTDIGLAPDGERVIALTVVDAERTVRIKPRRVVLACGGLETTRLLLQAQQQRPEAFGGPNGSLGRYYMGHISGKIADIVLTDPATAAVHDFYLDEGTFVRRRFTLTAAAQLRERLLNTAFWADNPVFHRPEHRSGVLSLVWLALAIAPLGRLLASEGVRTSHVGPRPRQWRRHVLNVLGSPHSTLAEIVAIVRARFLSSPRKPGFLLRNRAGRYALHYHAEHAPNRESRVKLGNTADALGLPFLDVELKFAERDAQSVLRAHELLDDALRSRGIGHLEYHQPAEARLASILQQASDGFHQIGTARMADTAAHGVVDANCRVHGVENLFVASTAIFPSSGQASPTFVAAALALRLAEHLSQTVRTNEPAAAAEREVV
ncbi:MAG TPA: FAD-dependent oxidoreductase [Xanthobacteraceae bacterium]|nr:FAD-dependent oxidoreductase [Xanthobacteraceae bacterium]